jgi:hypothetical protein
MLVARKEDPDDADKLGLHDLRLTHLLRASRKSAVDKIHELCGPEPFRVHVRRGVRDV